MQRDIEVSFRNSEQVAASCARAWVCSKWLVAKRLLSEVSTVAPVAVQLWRHILFSSSVRKEGSCGCPPGEGGPGTDGDNKRRNKRRSDVVGLLPESVRRALEDELWAELALHFESNCVLLQVSAGVWGSDWHIAQIVPSRR